MTEVSKDLISVLGKAEGRRLVRRILEQSNAFGASYAKADALATAYNEGLRAVGLWLMHEINRADPEALGALLREGRNNG